MHKRLTLPLGKVCFFLFSILVLSFSVSIFGSQEISVMVLVMQKLWMVVIYF